MLFVTASIFGAAQAFSEVDQSRMLLIEERLTHLEVQNERQDTQIADNVNRINAIENKDLDRRIAVLEDQANFNRQILYGLIGVVVTQILHVLYWARRYSERGLKHE